MVDDAAERYRRLAKALLQRIYPINQLEARAVVPVVVAFIAGRRFCIRDLASGGAKG